jgi:hypothetical protein
VSKKQGKANREYSKLRKQFLEANPECVAGLMNCRYEATDVHHSAGRGEKFLDTETWVPVCRPCHLFLESHPLKAKELGLSKSRLTK